MPATAKQERVAIEKPRHKTLKRKREVEDVEDLENRVRDLDLAETDATLFSDLPLSEATLSGLEASHFKTLTDVQKRAVPLALKKSDILGAAKTGSGKTLAFLVPVLENLYRKRWTEFDGVGALILSPTRELAIQIFEVLRNVGRFHAFSAGLVIGGKSLQEERDRLGKMNILICTPGRMLQHLDQTAALDIGNLQMLVLDEADRIMDLGFQKAVDAILEHLPKERQTLLFSATQTKRVSDLARLSLRSPEYVSVHESATTATPSTLQQHYVVTALPEKLDTLWSFIRANVKSKILVFLSSGKQVRFVYEGFRRLQPGIPLLHLHGRQKQTARLEITSKFSATKNSCLFATDVVARGLDFPAVDWVIQLDCPEDVDTYIHRVGRTARYERNGRAVLFLDPSEEEGMIDKLERKRVPIEKINVRQKKQQSIRSQLQNMCFKDPELKYLGQKAFVSYVRSIYLQRDKEVFRISELPLEEFASSLGLPGTPRIKFHRGENLKELKNAPKQIAAFSSSEEDDQPKRTKDVKEVKTKYDRMFDRINQDILAGHYQRLVDADGEDEPGQQRDADEDDDFLTVKRRLSDASDVSELSTDGALSNTKRVTQAIPVVGKDPMIIDSKRREKLLKSKKALLKLKGQGTKLLYDEEGNPHQIYELEDEEQFKERGPAHDQREEFMQKEQARVQAADLLDKQTAKEKKRERKERRRRAQEALTAEDAVGSRKAVLVPFEGGEEYQSGDDEDLQAGDELEVGHPQKRSKKWFEDPLEDEKSAPKKQYGTLWQQPENLEDLEALASGMLN